MLSGGGGFGSPLEREAELVADDVREGYVSAQVSREVYAVALDGRGAARRGDHASPAFGAASGRPGDWQRCGVRRRLGGALSELVADDVSNAPGPNAYSRS